MTSEELKNNICRILDSKKAADITILDVERLTVLADYFIIAGGTSTTNVKALAEYVEEKMEEAGVPPIRKEGLKDARWVVYDYGNVILHILLDDMRLFYCLEKLWSDGKNLEKYVAEEYEPTKTPEKALKITQKTPEKAPKTAQKTIKNKTDTTEKTEKAGIKAEEKTIKAKPRTAKAKADAAEKVGIKTEEKTVKAKPGTAKAKTDAAEKTEKAELKKKETQSRTNKSKQTE
jgi:ribosome-associated protein